MDGKIDRLARVRALIGNGRREINRANPRRARELLKPVWHDCDDLVGTIEWVDLALTMAETFLAEGRAEAEKYFQEAFARLDQIHDPPAELRMRACEAFANFLFSVARRPLTARPFCEEAKTLAVTCGSKEDVARVQLRLLSIQLTADNDPQYGNFQSLMRVGNEGEFKSQEILRAWAIHQGRSEEQSQGLQYARKATNALDSYFRKLLDESRGGGNSDQLHQATYSRIRCFSASNCKSRTLLTLVPPKLPFISDEKAKQVFAIYQQTLLGT
jgi:hypothetical protein